MTGPPQINDALTNELSINRLSLLLNKVYGLPEAKYKFIDYKEEATDTTFTAYVRLAHENIRITFQFEGPMHPGTLDWGVKVGDQHVRKEETDGGLTVYHIKGYLNPT